MISDANDSTCRIDKPLGPSVAVFVAYGIDISDEATTKTYERMLQWFQSYGRHPDRGGISGEGFPERVIAFKTVQQRLAKSGFNRVVAIDVGVMVPDGYFICDYWMKASIDREKAHAVLAVDESIAMFRELTASAVVADLVSLLAPTYVIAYAKDRKFGPELYAVGIPHGLNVSGTEYEHARNISRWCDTGIPRRVYDRGLLRDVYPLSFLNASQLQANVAGVSLGDWITRSPNRGVLTPHCDGLHRWEIPREQIADMRAVLWKEGVVFDWTRHTNV